MKKLTTIRTFLYEYYRSFKGMLKLNRRIYLDIFSPKNPICKLCADGVLSFAIHFPVASINIYLDINNLSYLSSSTDTLHTSS